MKHSSIVFLVQKLENAYVHYDVMMLDYIQSMSLPSCNSIKTIEFSTFYYSTVLHSKLKNRLRELVQLCFIKQNGAPLLADLFLYSYEADFIQGLLKKNERKLARSFKFTFRYIEDVLSLNNSRLGDFIDHIYPTDSEGRIRTKL